MVDILPRVGTPFDNTKSEKLFYELMRRRITIKQDYSERSDTHDREWNRSEGADVNLIDLARVILHRRRLLVALVGTVVIVTAILVFSISNRYASRATILPSGNTNTLSDLTSLVGLSTGLEVGDENSSALFPVILGSQRVRDAVLDREYSFNTGSEHRHLHLSEYFEQDNPDKLREAVAGITTVGTDSRTGQITVQVETKYPELSQEIVAAYLQELENYNLYKRRSAAGDNEKYLARQLVDAKRMLTDAEQALVDFRKVNAGWDETSSPEVISRQGQLVREVEVRNTAYLFLQQQYELAKLEAQKDVPIVRILDQPSLPTRKSGPHRLRMIVLAGMVSFMFAVFGICVAYLGRKAVYGNNREACEQLSGDFAEAFPRTSRLYGNVRGRHGPRRESVPVE